MLVLIKYTNIPGSLHLLFPLSPYECIEMRCSAVAVRGNTKCPTIGVRKRVIGRSGRDLTADHSINLSDPLDVNDLTRPVSASHTIYGKTIIRTSVA